MALIQQPAPRVFISYSHETIEYQERVLGLADRLRTDGIDAEIDQYNAVPPEGWLLWCERQIEAADFVLLVCTETYLRWVDGEAPPGIGHGVLWEARIIRQLLYYAGAVSDKFVPVLFSDISPEHLPTPIKGGTRYVVDTEDGYEELYRRLTGQPRLLRPALGKINPLPTRRRQWSEGAGKTASATPPPLPSASSPRAAGPGQLESLPTTLVAAIAVRQEGQEARSRALEDQARHYDRMRDLQRQDQLRRDQRREDIRRDQRREDIRREDQRREEEDERQRRAQERDRRAAEERLRSVEMPRGMSQGTRSFVLKVLVFAAAGVLIAIGLGFVGAKVLPFFNTTRKAKPKGGGEGSTATYPADCSVFAPPALPAGGTIMVQVFLHPPELADAVQKAARLFDTTAAPRGFTSLSLELKKGARVGFQLQAPDICISDDGLGEISWQNRVTGVQFLVGVPADCHPGARPATLRVFVEGVPAGRIHFLIGVEAAAACVGEPQPRGDVARNYRKAFISYASEDRTEVLKRVPTLSALGVAFFQDVLDLEPGQRWEKALYLQIHGSDLFLLFWSAAARRSSWVGKEIVYALECQKQDPDGAPDIVPVIIEGPPPPPPPSELAELHFNDKLIYFMRC